MAKRKLDLALDSGVHYTPNVQGVDQDSVVQQEKNVLTGILDGQYKEKYTNLNKTSGARTEITYFKQIPNNEDNAVINLSGFNRSDPNLSQYIRIHKLAVRMDTIQSNFDETEGNGPKTIGFDGKMIVLPNTILPSPNDFFTMKHLDRTRLFKVSAVNPLSGDDESAYDVEFCSADTDFTYENSELSKMVVDDAYFEETYLGTELRTVFRKSEYFTLKTIQKFYKELGLLFKEYFWNKDLESYSLVYQDNLNADSSDNNGSGIYGTSDEARCLGLSARKCIVIGDDSDTEEYDDEEDSKPSYEFNQGYNGREMYDSDLIEFILSNRIFESIEEFPTIPTQFGYNRRPNSYNQTLFYALETKNRRRFLSHYFLPVELNISTPGTQPVLYGKVSLMHVSGSSGNTLSLYPEDLFDVIQNQSTEELPFSDVAKQNVFILMEYLLSLYINKLEKNLFNVIDLIYSKFDVISQFKSEIIQYQAFYLFPMVGFVLKEVADSIVTRNSDENLLSDPIQKSEIQSK